MKTLSLSKKCSYVLSLILILVMFSACADKDTNQTGTGISESVTPSETTVSSEPAGSEESTSSVTENTPSFPLEDGVYLVDFDTDSSMFHVNEAYEGKAKLTVLNGEAVLHLVMPSKNVLNLYLGLAEDAKKEGASVLNPTIESVAYADGYEEEVYAYDVLVTEYDSEFDLALIGKKEVWYDHKVKISNAIPWTESENDPSNDDTASVLPTEEGTYQVQVSFEGGTGKVKLASPTKLEKNQEGYVVTLTWSSKNYDYMIVDGTKYLPVDTNEQSVFEIPVSDITVPISVIADTVAMSTPHEIEYVITFDVESIE